MVRGIACNCLGFRVISSRFKETMGAKSSSRDLHLGLCVSTHRPRRLPKDTGKLVHKVLLIRPASMLHNKIPIYAIFYLLKGDYIPQGPKALKPHTGI